MYFANPVIILVQRTIADLIPNDPTFWPCRADLDEPCDPHLRTIQAIASRIVSPLAGDFAPPSYEQAWGHRGGQGLTLGQAIIEACRDAYGVAGADAAAALFDHWAGGPIVSPDLDVPPALTLDLTTDVFASDVMDLVLA